MKQSQFYEELKKAGFTKSLYRMQDYRKELGLTTDYKIEDIPLYLEWERDAIERKRDAGRKTKGNTHPAWNKGLHLTEEQKENISKKLKGIPKPPRSKEHVEKIKASCNTNEFKIKMSKIGAKRAQEGRNKKTIKFDTLYFDSKWELIYYLWARENKLEIERSIPFELPSGHHYIVDFRINGKLVEIKGSHFFNDKGELINPYNNPDKIQDEHSREKQQFWEENDVEVVKDISPYLESLKGTKSWFRMIWTLKSEGIPLF